MKSRGESIFKVFLPKNTGLFSGESIFLYKVNLKAMLASIYAESITLMFY